MFIIITKKEDHKGTASINIYNNTGISIEKLRLNKLQFGIPISFGFELFD